MREAPLDPSHLNALKDIVRTRYGLVFPQSRRHDLEAGIRRTMADECPSDPDRFLQLVESDDRVSDAMVARITVRETYFFREPRQFDVLRERVLPDLRGRVAANDRLRIWSAGCATGEEPYSLAILLEQEGLGDRADITATDVSLPALTLARKAHYGAWSLRNDTEGIALRYFERRKDQFILRENLRSRVSFRQLNLASDSYPNAATGIAGLDLILCRNVLIYFDEETIRRVARQLFQSLRPGGWLVMGPSDPPLWDFAPYRTQTTAGGIFYRRADADEPEQQRDGTLAAFRQPDASPELTPPPAPTPRYTPSWPETTIRPTAKAEDLQLATSGGRDLTALTATIRDTVNRGAPLQAEGMATAALHAHPLSPELHFLHAVILMELARHNNAVAALRKAIYLSPDLALGHFMLGSVLQRSGEIAAARRAYRNVLALCRSHAPDAIVPLSQGERFAGLLEATLTQISRLGTSLENAP